MKAADDAEATLNSIQLRRDDLNKQTNWSQPAILQQHMLIAEVTHWLLFEIIICAWMVFHERISFPACNYGEILDHRLRITGGKQPKHLFGVGLVTNSNHKATIPHYRAKEITNGGNCRFYPSN